MDRDALIEQVAIAIIKAWDGDPEPRSIGENARLAARAALAAIEGTDPMNDEFLRIRAREIAAGVKTLLSGPLAAENDIVGYVHGHLRHLAARPRLSP